MSKLTCAHNAAVKEIKTVSIGKDFYRLITWKCLSCKLQTKTDVR